MRPALGGVGRTGTARAWGTRRTDAHWARARGREGERARGREGEGEACGKSQAQQFGPLNSYPLNSTLAP